MSKYTLRNDVVLETVHGVNMLISLRTAWDSSPFILQVTEQTAFIWRTYRETKSFEILLDRLRTERGLSAEHAEKICESFREACLRLKYFLPEDET